MSQNRYNSIKINIQKYALSFAIIVPLFRPRSITQFGSIERVFYFGQVLLACALISYILVRLLKKGTKAFSTIGFIVIIYKLWETFAIFYNGFGNLSTIVNASMIVGATLFTEYMISKAPLEYFGVLSLYTGVLVLINNISYFIDGFSQLTDATGNIVYFWQTRNHLASLYFITLISSFIINGIKRTKIFSYWNLFVLFNVLWGTIEFQSATLAVGIVVYLILYFLFKKRTILYRPITYYLGGLGLHVAIVIFRIQEVFSYIIENLLQRTLTMSGRTAIWDASFIYILRRPFMGSGQSSVFSFSVAASEIPAHNQFLDIAIICGIPGLILFLILLFIAFLQLKNYKESVIARIVCCSLLAYIVMSITESPNPYQPWFILLGLIPHIQDLDGKFIYIKYKLTRRGTLICTRERGNM